MKREEFVQIIRKVVRDEIKEVFSSKSNRSFIREIIGEEVRGEVDRLLTEIESNQGEKLSITENNDDVRISKMVERGELPPVGRKQVPLGLSKNPIMNKMLNETLVSLQTGQAMFPSALGPEAQVEHLKEQYVNHKSDKDIVRPTSDNGSGKSVSQMLPSQDVNGNPLVIDPNRLPGHVQKALTRKYKVTSTKTTNRNF